jgi:hypothetical protein
VTTICHLIVTFSPLQRSDCLRRLPDLGPADLLVSTQRVTSQKEERRKKQDG